MSSQFLDTNVVMHAFGKDEQTAECKSFMLAVAAGEVRVTLDIVVLHELSYSVPRYRKQLTKTQIAEMLIWIVTLKGIDCDHDLFLDTISRWSSSPGLSFVDAYLSSRAIRDNGTIYSKNVRELRVQGVTVPDPLPQLIGE